jgi:mycofactocin system creatininase family protein
MSEPFAPVQVLDRLEVGPTLVEERRIVTPYRVSRAGGTESADLVYRWEEPVFAPGEPGSVGLAAMIGAQVALNYGLFCREIVFHGPYDELDRAFIARFAAHTAREIYVNKLLAPNPFLHGPAAELPIERRRSYLLATLAFQGDPPPAGATAWPRLDPEEAGHLVLSSGGKDSLLTYGLLAEMGLEPHPVFVNESGKHWFTALNAYRWFAAEVPRTARVWTNADRVFNFMLRQLPFVRPDFARVRADIYPLRLWTVAVFLFGALPLLRRRRVDRLLIGDEYDTTLRLNHRGITHYGGLYDQSRLFDQALTRYFARKGWGVQQFSVLRTLSELLIEKTLAERYPHLLARQMSCHATHSEAGTVRPCGRCEKCSRIVAMLSALGQDPSACGYGRAQIDRVLDELPHRPLHQESAVTAHALHLLRRHGQVPDSVAATPHPEVLQLRFDPLRSPPETLPRDLRAPLYRILLEHADGAVRRQGRVWVPFDPLGDGSLSASYPFERPDRRPREDRGDERAADAGTYLLGEMTWPRAEARLAESDVALLPVGAIEQHGPHLPLDTDAFDALALAQDVARSCAAPRPLVLPLIPYGVSYHHDDFPGTLSIRPDTLAGLVHEVGLAAARHGITKLVIVNGHGGNGPALHYAAQLINRDAHIFTCVETGETSDADVDELAETPNDVHAGEIETSTSLHLRPHLVRMERAEACVPRFSSRYLDFTARQSVGWYARTSRISPNGVLGDPTCATRAKGEQMWQLMVRHLVGLVEDIKALSLDEIHQPRY